MDFNELAEILFPNVDKAPEYYEKLYPPRNLDKNVKVTRPAPSPTGFIHLGTLFITVTDERLAHQSGGVLYIRIDDTDAKREVEGGVEAIISGLEYFGIKFDEGTLTDGDKGGYGPYRQRQRKEIYQTFAKYLVSIGKAYPCFCGADDLSEIRREQKEIKATTGYYGKWAKCRNLKTEEIKKALKEGKPFVLRYFSTGDETKTVKFHDELRGEIRFPEYSHDDVLLKSDGIPTYHLAHVIDDHLMRTTHVVRAEEWLSSVPYHMELFKAFDWDMPKYVHTAQVMKMDGASKRKLSKRKDPEISLDFYKEQGYPKDAVIEYLLTILNSNYEQWRLENPLKPYTEFKFTVEKMSASGMLFDILKLDDISRNTIALYTVEKVYDEVAGWSLKYDGELHGLLTRDRDYAMRIFSVGRNVPKPRKDITKWSGVREYISFFYDELFKIKDEYPANTDNNDVKKILEKYIDVYDPADDRTEWFNKIRTLTNDCGFCGDMKEYKKEPEKYRGNVCDVSAVIRIAVIGRTNSPDMYELFDILGYERVKQRLLAALDRK